MEAFCVRCNAAMPAICPKCGGDIEHQAGESKVEAYRKLILLLAGAKNLKLTIACLQIVSGDAVADGVTPESVARVWKLSPEMVRKHVREISLALELG